MLIQIKNKSATYFKLFSSGAVIVNKSDKNGDIAQRRPDPASNTNTKGSVWKLEYVNISKNKNNFFNMINLKRQLILQKSFDKTK